MYSESTGAIPVDDPRAAPVGIAATSVATMSVATMSFAAMANDLSAVIDEVSGFDRDIARLHGLRAEAVDRARLTSELPDYVAASGGRGMSRRSFLAELGCALRLSERAAGALIAESTTLFDALPGTLAALRGGSISYRHAQVLIDHAEFLEPELCAALEAAALPWAGALSPAAFNRKVRQVREGLDPESMTARRVRAATDRRIECIGAHDGMAWLSAYLPVAQAVAIFSRVTETARSIQSAEERRTLAQLRVDVFAASLLGDGDGSRDNHLADTYRQIRPRVMVTVPVLRLLGGARLLDGASLLSGTNEPASLEGYGPIDAETARLLTAEAPSLTRLLTHPETGVVLSVGHEKYRVPNELRAWLRVRDGTCRFPSCGRTAANCDLDHTEGWAHSGDTEWSNLAHLCPKHHKLKHEGGWHASQDAAGALAWSSPAGKRYSTWPAQAMAAQALVAQALA